MKTKLFLMAFICLFPLLNVLAQEKLDVMIITVPNDAFVKVNDQLLTKAENEALYQLELPVGKHIISIWSPAFSLVTDTINVEKGKRNIFKKPLKKLSPEFKAYKKKLFKYRFQKIEQISINTAVIAGNAALLWYFLDGTRVNELERVKGRAEQDKFLYESNIVPEFIESSRLNYEKHVAEYNEKRERLIIFRAIGIPVFLASSYFSYKFLKKYNIKKNKLKAPVYQYENPFTNLDWGVENNQFVIRYNF